MKFINAALLVIAAPFASTQAQVPLNEAADALIEVKIGAVDAITYNATTKKVTITTINDIPATADATPAETMAQSISNSLHASAPVVFLTLHDEVGADWGTKFEDPLDASCVVSGADAVATIGATSTGNDIPMYTVANVGSTMSMFDQLSFLQTNDLRHFFGDIDAVGGAHDVLDTQSCGQQAMTKDADGVIDMCITSVSTIGGIAPATWDGYLGGATDGYHVMEQNCQRVTFISAADGEVASVEVKPVAHIAHLTMSAELKYYPELLINLCSSEDVNLGEQVCVNVDVFGLPDSYFWTCRTGDTEGIMSITTAGDSESGTGDCDGNFHVNLHGSAGTSVLTDDCSINDITGGMAADSTCDARTLFYQPQNSQTSSPQAASTLNSKDFRFRTSLIVRLPSTFDANLDAANSESLLVTVTFDDAAWTQTQSS